MKYVPYIYTAIIRFGVVVMWYMAIDLAFYALGQS